MKKKTSLFRRRNVKRQVRKRRVRFFLLGLSGLALFAAAGWGTHALLTRLELFSLKKIEIRGGPKTLSHPQIVGRTGVRLGTNLFKLDLQEIRSRLKQHEFFKNVYVHRRLPGTLVLEIQEFYPEFVLFTGRMYYVDAQGKIFRDITDTDDKRDFVVFSGFNEEELLNEPGLLQEVLKKAYRLKKAYQETDFARLYGISEIHFEKNIGFTLYPEKQKYSIKFGNKDFLEKIKKLSQVLDKVQNSELQFSSIDLNYPGKVLMTL